MNSQRFYQVGSSLVADFGGAEEHVVRPTELERVKIEIEFGGQLFAVPGIAAHELFVVFAGFVPACEERAAEVEAFTVPALGNHVELATDLFLVDFYWFVRIGNVKNAHFSVTEAIDEESFVIGAEADIDGENAALGANIGDFLGLPLAVLVFENEPELGSEGGGGKGVIILFAPGPTDFERRAWHLEDFLRLTSMEVPEDGGISELFHGFGIGGDFAEVARVVVPSGEGSCEEDVLAWQDTSVVPVAVGEFPAGEVLGGLFSGQPVGGNVIAFIAVFDESGMAAFVACIREARDEDTTGQGVDSVGSNGSASLLFEIFDGFDETRTSRISVDIEDEDFAGFETGEPELAAIVGEATVVRFVASADGMRVDDLAVIAGAWLDVDGDELVGTVALSIDAEGPNVDEFLLALDPSEVGRGAGFVSLQRLGI